MINTTEGESLDVVAGLETTQTSVQCAARSLEHTALPRLARRQFATQLNYLLSQHIHRALPPEARPHLANLMEAIPEFLKSGDNALLTQHINSALSPLHQGMGEPLLATTASQTHCYWLYWELQSMLKLLKQLKPPVEANDSGEGCFPATQTKVQSG